MPPLPSLNTHVNGDENSVHACAAALHEIAQGAQSGADAFAKAKGDSEHWWPKGQGAEAFRSRMGQMGSGAGRVAERIAGIAHGLDAFADSLAAVKKQMAQARAAAGQGTLTVTGETIEGPDVPMPRAQSALEAVKMVAYVEAGHAVLMGRQSEASAHTTLDALLTANKTALHDLDTAKWWMLGGATLDGIGRLVDGSRTWSTVADREAAMAAKWEQDLARFHYSPDDPALPRLAKAAGIAESDAATAATKAASYQGLLDGFHVSNDGRIAGMVTRSHLGELPGALGAVGEKIPDVGALFAAGQTSWDVSHAHGAVEKAKAVGSDLGGFAVGTGVTEGLIMAGMVGGPATLGAVVIGAGVAWGVGEAIHHWSGITNFVGDIF